MVFFLCAMIFSWKEGGERILGEESFLKKRNDDLSEVEYEFSQKKRDFLEPVEEGKRAESKEGFIEFFNKESSLYFDLGRKECASRFLSLSQESI